MPSNKESQERGYPNAAEDITTGTLAAGLIIPVIQELQAPWQLEYEGPGLPTLESLYKLPWNYV